MSLNEAVDTFKNQMIANGYEANYLYANVHTLIGFPTIIIRYANVINSQAAANGILENCPGYMGFLVHDDRNVFTIEKPTTHSSVLWRSGLKFRKITAATPQEAVQKLAAWFQRNQHIIHAVGTRHNYS